MNTRLSAALALSGGMAIVWLVPYAAAWLWQAPWTTPLVRWLRLSFPESELPVFAMSGMLPVFLTAFIVGALVFTFRGTTKAVFALLAAPFVIYSLVLDVGFWFAAGSSISAAISRPYPWLVAIAVPVGLAVALLVSRVKVRSAA